MACAACFCGTAPGVPGADPAGVVGVPGTAPLVGVDGGSVFTADGVPYAPGAAPVDGAVAPSVSPLPMAWDPATVRATPAVAVGCAPG